MSAKPILFSGPMVRALLDGRKTQTRRVLKPQPFPVGGPFYQPFPRQKPREWHSVSDNGLIANIQTISYAPGDLLWVKETYRAHAEYDGLKPSDIPVGADLQFPADDPLSPWDSKQRPSIFMPRWASRLTLRVTDVRVQRLQGISEEDATAEGATPELVPPDGGGCPHVEGFRDLWSSIHGPGAWNANPWVCAVSFEVIQANIAEVAG